MQLYFIRHTTPAIQADVCYGQSDIDVANTFHEESEQINDILYKHIGSSGYDLIYSSPAQRCLKLAKAIEKQQASTVEISIQADLLEVNFGDWELTPWNDIPLNESREWMEDYINIRPPNGESLLDLQLRLRRFLKNILTLKHDSVAICTHAGILRLIAAEYLDIPLKSIFNLQLNYGQIIILTQHKNSFSLRFVN